MNALHPLAPEAVMAYLDGEVTAAEARDIQTHLAACGTCQQLAADLREGSRQLREWQVDEPPPTLVAPERRARTRAQPSGVTIVGAYVFGFVARHRLAAGAAAVVVVLGSAIVFQSARKMPVTTIAVSSMEAAESLETVNRFQSQRLGGSTTSFNSAGRPQGVPVRSAQPGIVAGPRIVRTATLRLVAGDFDRVRPAIDRILKGVGGFVGGITDSDRPGSPRSIRGTLRIPTAQFDSALTSLRALGHVTEESQGADDVTATVADLDVRLANSRVTERRLSELLRNRTGTVSDVLEVEREMARVRTEIEQMEAERKQLDRRIEYATLTLEVVEERAAAGNLGPIPIPTRLRHAIADGVESAAMSMLEAVLFALRAGPALLLWTIVLGLPAWLFVRRYAVRPVQRPGGV